MCKQAHWLSVYHDMTVCTASWMQTAVYHKTVLKLYFRNITYSFQQKGHVYYTQYIAGKNGGKEGEREREESVIRTVVK